MRCAIEKIDIFFEILSHWAFGNCCITARVMLNLNLVHTFFIREGLHAKKAIWFANIHLICTVVVVHAFFQRHNTRLIWERVHSWNVCCTWKITCCEENNCLVCACSCRIWDCSCHIIWARHCLFHEHIAFLVLHTRHVHFCSIINIVNHHHTIRVAICHDCEGILSVAHDHFIGSPLCVICETCIWQSCQAVPIHFYTLGTFIILVSWVSHHSIFHLIDFDWHFMRYTIENIDFFFEILFHWVFGNFCITAHVMLNLNLVHTFFIREGLHAKKDKNAIWFASIHLMFTVVVVHAFSQRHNKRLIWERVHSWDVCCTWWVTCRDQNDCIVIVHTALVHVHTALVHVIMVCIKEPSVAEDVINPVERSIGSHLVVLKDSCDTIFVHLRSGRVCNDLIEGIG